MKATSLCTRLETLIYPVPKDQGLYKDPENLDNVLSNLFHLQHLCLDFRGQARPVPSLPATLKCLELLNNPHISVWQVVLTTTWVDLKELNLTGCRPEAHLCTSVECQSLQIPTKSTLTSLSLKGAISLIFPEYVRITIRLLQSPKLQQVDLSDNQLQTPEILKIAQHLSTKKYIMALDFRVLDMTGKPVKLLPYFSGWQRPCTIKAYAWQGLEINASNIGAISWIFSLPSRLLL